MVTYFQPLAFPVGEQEIAPGSVGPLEERMRLAEPARRRLDAPHDREPRVLRVEAGENPRGAVGRPVLDHDHLDAWIVLSEVGPHSMLDPALLVASGNHDRDERGARRRGPGRRETPDGDGIDPEKNEADQAERGRGDQGRVQEG